MKEYKVYFDASVIIAALLSPNGGSALLFAYIKKEVIIGVVSQTVIEEIMEEEKFIKLKRTRKGIETFIGQSGLLVRESITEKEVAVYEGWVDAEDVHLLAGAKSTACEYLVTLDKKHLLKTDVRKKCLPLQILSPKELLEKIVDLL